MNTLGQELKQQRELTKKTMKQLSDLSGLSQSFISQIENNKRKPSYEAMFKIIVALSRDVSRELVNTDSKFDWDQEEIEEQYRMLLYTKFAPFFDNDEKKMLYETLMNFDLKNSLGEGSYVDDIMHRSSDLSQIINFTFNEAPTFYLDNKSLTKSEYNKIKTLLKGLKLEREEQN